MGDIKDLPKGNEILLLLARKAQGFLQDESDVQLRPYILLLYEISPGTVLVDNDLVTDNLGQLPKSELVLKMIETNIRKPRNGVVKRPATVIFTSEKLYRDLGAPLFKHGIVTKLWTEEENQGFGDDIVVQYSKRLREKQQLGYQGATLKPGILTTVSKERAESFFQAAAEFYRLAPWKTFKAKEMWSISTPDMPGARLFFMAAGAKDGSGVTLGMETDPENLFHLLEKGERKVLDDSPGAYHRCLLFTTEWGTPIDDLDAIEKYHWELGAEPTPEADCYPFPFSFKHDADEGLMRPPREDIEWFEVAMRVLSKFAHDWRSQKLTENNARDVSYTVSSWNKAYKTTVSHWGFAAKDLAEAWPSIVEKGKPPVQPAAPAAPRGPIVEGENCIVCAKKENLIEGITLKRCGGCKKKLYCSRECQASDWAAHKLKCNKS